MRQQLDTAIRHSLAAQARNRFAWILLVAFVPVWYLADRLDDPAHRRGVHASRHGHRRWWWTATTSR